MNNDDLNLSEDPQTLLNFACEMGMRLIRNGAEIYRVEESLKIILKSYGVSTADIFAIPCLILINFEQNGVNYTKSMRVKNYSNNLKKLSMINNLSREISNNSLPLKDAVKKLDKIVNIKNYPFWVGFLSYGAVAMLFTLFWGGTFIDSLFAMVSGFIVKLCTVYNNKRNTNLFFSNVLSGTLLSIIPIVVNYIFSNFINLDIIIIGVIMLLVPGIAIANVLRDILAGDTITAISRFTEVIITGIGIAIGIAIPTGIFGLIFR